MSGATRTLFITPAYLIENTVVNSNVDQKLLAKCIRTAEDKFLLGIVGSPLWESLTTKINNNTLTGVYKTLVDSFIIPCLLEYSLFEYIPFTAFKFKNKGIESQSSPDSNAASLNDLSYLREQVKDSASFYAERLIKYLKANTQSFPEYYQFLNIDDVRPARSDYFSGIQFPGMNRRSGRDDIDGLGITFPLN